MSEPWYGEMVSAVFDEDSPCPVITIRLMPYTRVHGGDVVVMSKDDYHHHADLADLAAAEDQ